jgi:hypothetical protein
MEIWKLPPSSKLLNIAKNIATDYHTDIEELYHYMRKKTKKGTTAPLNLQTAFMKV